MESRTTARHEGGRLCNGRIEGGEVVCPLHGYKFNLETGACSTDPKLKVKVFKLVRPSGITSLWRDKIVVKKRRQATLKPFSRRRFLELSASSLGLLLAGMPKGWVGGVYAGEAPETTKVRFGIIALTDCSSIVHRARVGAV